MTPTLQLDVIGRRGSVTATAIVDTGFEGELCLPTTAAVELGLELVGEGEAELADGTVIRELLFAASVSLLGNTRQVTTSLTRSQDALIGTELLRGCHLSIDIDTGRVRVKRKRK